MIASAELMFLLGLVLPPAAVVIGVVIFAVASRASRRVHAPVATHVQAA